MAQQAEAKIFIKQEDGSLKPSTLPERVAYKLGVYQELRALGLSQEEIHFILSMNLVAL